LEGIALCTLDSEKPGCSYCCEIPGFSMVHPPGLEPGTH
jgi:hypothetical protein